MSQAPQRFNPWRRIRHLPGLLVDVLAAGAKRLAHTYRVRVVDPHGFMQGQGWPAIYVIWHNRVLLMAELFPPELQRRSSVIVSASRDGEYAADYIRRFGLEVIRGSSSRGGREALHELRRTLGAGRTVVLTLDGPRGPRYTVQPGAIVLAEMTGVPIVPASLNALCRWEARGWDRTQVPAPYSQVELVIGAPLRVPGRLTPDERVAACHRLREALLEITVDARHVPFPADVQWHAPDVPDEVRQALTAGAWLRRPAPVQPELPPVVHQAVWPPAPAGFRITHGVAARRWLGPGPTPQAEFARLADLAASGAPVAAPVALGEAGRHRLLVTACPVAGEPFATVWTRDCARPGLRRALVAAVGRFVKVLREEQVPIVPAADRVLVAAGGADGPRLVLVPPATGGVPPCGQSGASAWLAWLAACPGWRPTEVAALLAAAGLPTPVGEAGPVWRRVTAGHWRDLHRAWSSQEPQWLAASEACDLRKTPRGAWLLTRGVTHADAEAALQAHESPRTGGPEVQAGGRSWRVYGFGPGASGRRRVAPGRQAWLSAHRLAACGVPVAEPVAWLRGRDGRSWLVTAASGDGVGRAVHGSCPVPTAPAGAEGRAWVTGLARLLGMTHAAGVDLPEAGVDDVAALAAPAGGGPRVGWAVPAEARFGVSLSPALRAPRLAAWLQTLGLASASWTRGRFLVAYAQAAHLSRAERRVLAARLG